MKESIDIASRRFIRFKDKIYRFDATDGLGELPQKLGKFGSVTVVMGGTEYKNCFILGEPAEYVLFKKVEFSVGNSEFRAYLPKSEKFDPKKLNLGKNKATVIITKEEP